MKLAVIYLLNIVHLSFNPSTLMASLSEVGLSHPASVVHAGGKLSSSAGHVESEQLATASHADTVEKTGHSK